MPSPLRLASVVGLIAGLVPAVQAGFNPDSDDNLSVYWGQNSANQVGPQGQQRLSFYCKNAPSINIIPLAFLDGIENPTLNLANAGNNCTAIANSGLLSCPQVEADIQECQSKYDKTIMLSLGGGTYSEGGFSSSSAAVSAAQNVWAMFGPVQSGSSAPRPFGTAVVNGFDFDFESTVQNMEPFVAELRSLMDAAKGTYYLSAAPQCPYPDLSDEGFIDGQVAMDWVQVQFYNNYCSVGQYPNNWNYATWDAWAKSVSANPSAKVLVGIPGNVGGANAGSYTSGSQLAAAIANAKSYSSFGGVMIWDMSQLWNNAGFLSQVVSDMGASGSAPAPTPSPIPAPTTKAASPTTLVTVTRPAATSAASSSGTVPQYGQCGGSGYTGPTQCQAPYSCVSQSIWWSVCK